MKNETMKLEKGKLAAFLKSLVSEYEVIVPTIENGNLQYGDLAVVKAETEFKGRPPVSPKEYLFPQKEKIFTFDAADKTSVAVKEHLNKKKRIIWGVRPCDLYGIKTLDTIFLGNYVDTYYQSRRKNTVLMGLNCNEPCATGFCSSCNTGPFAKEAYDLSFTDLGDKYLVNIGTEEGKKIVGKAQNFFSASTDADVKSASDAEKKSQRGFKVSVDAKAVKQKMPQTSNNGFWAEESANCMLCGGCNFVCPTCHCFNIEDIAEDGKTSTRVRYWDSCQLGGFTQMAAENTRHTQSERLRQRIFHKYVYTPDKYDGVPGCTGCGRCIEVCPAEIDITHILGRVMSK